MKPKQLSLGSNIEPRKNHIEKSLYELQKFCEITKISPLYETAPLLDSHATDPWLLPFLNCIIEIDIDKTPQEFLQIIKNIESQQGRNNPEKWAPRPIDIDILTWGDLTIDTEDLKIPHPEMANRSFVMDPLKDIDSDYIKKAREKSSHLPLWMGIINLTPDSFSDQLSCEHFEEKIKHFYDIGVHIFDFGAESTRPHAALVSEFDEWERLKPHLIQYKNIEKNWKLKPLLSLDSYKPQVISKALEYGIDIINDISGMTSTETLSLLKNTDAQYVLTHNSNRFDPSTIPKNKNTIDAICLWLEDKMELFEKNKISLSRIIFDPGIGFGKTSRENIEILKNISLFKKYPLRLLIGHSRKSFMESFSSQKADQRDIETLGISMKLIQEGVDILRIHNPELHIRASRAWNHVTS